MGRVIVFLALVVGLGWAAVAAWNYLVASVREHEAEVRWEEFSKVVTVVGTPLVENAQSASEDLDSQATRLLAIHNSNLTVGRPELGRAWAQIQNDADRGLFILNAIREIDNVKPSNADLLRAFIGALAQDDEESSRRLVRKGVDRGLSEMSKSDRQTAFREAEASLNSSIGHLRELAQDLSNDERSGDLSIRYRPAWQGVFDSDAVDLQNNTGQTLEKAAVFVTVHMSDGSTKTHVHYANEWLSGTELEALYRYYSSDYSSSQTGAHPDNVEAVIYTRTGTLRSSYALTSDEWDKLTQSYCSRLSFSGNYLGAYEDSDGHKAAGYQFQFQGLRMLPLQSVEVDFTSQAGGTQSHKWSYNNGSTLEAGKTWWFRSPDLDSSNPPDHIDYILEFAGTNYVQRVHAY